MARNCSIYHSQFMVIYIEHYTYKRGWNVGVQERKRDKNGNCAHAREHFS